MTVQSTMPPESASVTIEGVTLVAGWESYAEETAVGLKWLGTPSTDDLRAWGQHVLNNVDTARWTMADILAEAMRQDGGEPGEVFSIVAGTFFERTHSTLRMWVTTANAWPLEERWQPQKGASFTHHVNLNPCSSEHRAALMAQSVQNLWSSNKLTEQRNKQYPIYAKETRGRNKTFNPQGEVEALQQDLTAAQAKIFQLETQLELTGASVGANGTKPSVAVTTHKPLFLRSCHIPAGRWKFFKRSSSAGYQLFTVDGKLGIGFGDGGVIWPNTDDETVGILTDFITTLD